MSTAKARKSRKRKTFDFLASPAELRNKMYALISLQEIQKYLPARRRKYDPPMAILRTCCQVRHECLPVFGDVTTEYCNLSAMKPRYALEHLAAMRVGFELVLRAWDYEEQRKERVASGGGAEEEEEWADLFWSWLERMSIRMGLVLL